MKKNFIHLFLGWVGIFFLVTGLDTLSAETLSNAQDETQNLALLPETKVSTSHVSNWESLAAVNDGYDPSSSTDRSHAVYGNWNEEANYGKTNWVEYEWLDSCHITSFSVYWFTDYGGLSQPTSAYIQYWKGSAWVNAGNIGRDLHKYNILNTNVVTTKVRINMASSTSTGIIEFKVFGQKMPDTEALKEAISQAQAVYDSEAAGAAALQAAITTAQGYLASSSATAVDQAIMDLQNAIAAYKYNNASPENPLDMTHFIVNQGFDNNNAAGWTGGGTVGYHSIEYYQKTFNLYQQISGLPAGKYILKVQGFERPKGNDSGAAYKNETEVIHARFYAKATDFSEKNILFNSLYKHAYSGSGALNGYVNTMAGAETMFTNTKNSYYEVTLPGILLDEGNMLTIGAKSDFQQNGYWAIFDNFRLEYIGAYDLDDLVVSAGERIKEAQELLTQKIRNADLPQLNAGISQVQQALGADPVVFTEIAAAKKVLDAAVAVAESSLNAYLDLQAAIDAAVLLLKDLEKQAEIEKLQAAIDAAKESVDNLDLTLEEINQATLGLKETMASVGKKIYIPTWMLGDVNDDNNAWSYKRSKQSKNWIFFWEKGFGDDPDNLVCGGNRADINWILNLAETSFKFYADSLKFTTRGSSKTDTYKMIIRLRYTTEWEASGSGVDNMIGLLTLTPWAASSRGGQTTAHEVGHCFQYQVHCDNNDQNGWMYGFGENASGGCGFWEQCAQWQAYKVFPDQQFTGEWFSGYLNNVHKHILHEAPRYENYFIQDYWTYLHGMDMIGRLWNLSKRPEDPVEAYKRITAITQAQFNEEMYDCAARFATWDIPALRSYGAGKISARPQPAMKDAGDDYWLIDPSVCPENYGHNIIKLNAPSKATTVSAYFEGKAGLEGYRKLSVSSAGWRYGFVALLGDGTRVYSDMGSAAYRTPQSTIDFECPANCKQLWLVVTGAPSTHWRHAWDDNDSNDEQWPYQVRFYNTNLLGKKNPASPVGIQDIMESAIELYASDGRLIANELPAGSVLSIYDVTGRCLLTETVEGTSFSTVLPSGIYLVNVTSGSGKITRKVMIK